MKKYHKINTMYKRDSNNHDKIVIGDYALPAFEYLKNNTWLFEEKVNGTNIRVIWNDNTIRYGGKTDDSQIPMSILDVLDKKFRTDEMIKLLRKDFPLGACFYGEGFGPKIAKGSGNYGKVVDFCLFDVYIDGWWLERHSVRAIGKQLGLKCPPKIDCGTLPQAAELCKTGPKSIWGDFEIEGLVLRPLLEICNRDGSRIIAKIKCKDFR